MQNSEALFVLPCGAHDPDSKRNETSGTRETKVDKSASQRVRKQDDWAIAKALIFPSLVRGRVCVGDKYRDKKHSAEWEGGKKEAGLEKKKENGVHS